MFIYSFYWKWYLVFCPFQFIIVLAKFLCLLLMSTFSVYFLTFKYCLRGFEVSFYFSKLTWIVQHPANSYKRIFIYIFWIVTSKYLKKNPWQRLMVNFKFTDTFIQVIPRGNQAQLSSKLQVHDSFIPYQYSHFFSIFSGMKYCKIAESVKINASIDMKWVNI